MRLLRFFKYRLKFVIEHLKDFIVINYQILSTLGIQILNEESQLFKKNNWVIDYTNAVIDYQRGFSRNIVNRHILSFEF